MNALIIAMKAWVMMVDPAAIDTAMELQAEYGLTYEAGCFVEEDGSGSCAGITFPAYDDFAPTHYTR